MAALAESIAQESCSGETAATRTVAPRRGLTLLAHGAALLLFTLLTITRTLPLMLHPASTVTPDLVDPVHHIWSAALSIHDVTTWRDGLWSLFDANIFYPTPHAASYADVFVGLLPLSLPLHLVIGNPVVLINVLLALSFVLSAYGAFLLGYRLTGRYAAALVAGLIFGFCPLRTENVGHVTVVSTEWQVAAAYCLVRAWDSHRRGWWVAAGIFAALSAITNLYYLAYLTPPLLVVAVMLLVKRAWTQQRLWNALLAAGIAMILIVPAVIPYLVRHATVDARYGAGGSTDILSFLRVFAGRPVDGLLLPTVPPGLMGAFQGLFPGFAAVVLAVIAWRRRQARLWGIFALACAIIALGPQLNVDGHILSVPLPYAWLSALVPHFSLFRDPVRATSGLYLGLAVLAAWGTRDILDALRLRGRRVLVGASLVCVVALELWWTVPTATLAAIPTGEQWLAHQPRIHAIVELPISNTTPLDWQRQTEIMYDSTVHWKALVNGSASVDPVGMARARAILGTYPSPQSLALLRHLHIDAVVLRLAWLSPEQRRAARAVCRVAYRDAVEEICADPFR